MLCTTARSQNLACQSLTQVGALNLVQVILQQVLAARTSTWLTSRSDRSCNPLVNRPNDLVKGVVLARSMCWVSLGSCSTAQVLFGFNWLDDQRRTMSSGLLQCTRALQGGHTCACAHLALD